MDPHVGLHLQPEGAGVLRIVVHNVQDPDSRIIAIRGTEGVMEWIDDAAGIPIPFRQVPAAGASLPGSTPFTVR